MKETLTCSNCSKNWKREKARGRKPHYCPACVKTLSLQTPVVYVKSASVTSSKKLQKVLTVSEKPKTAKEEKMIPAPSHWQCPSCKVYIGVEVAIPTPPVHKCEKRARRLLALEQIPKKPSK